MKTTMDPNMMLILMRLTLPITKDRASVPIPQALITPISTSPIMCPTMSAWTHALQIHISINSCVMLLLLPSTESSPHPWTTANPYTIDAPADESHYGYSESHEWGSVGAPPMEKPYSTPLMGSATQPNAISHIADGQGQAGSSSGVTHPYHPLQNMQIGRAHV